MKKLTGCSKVIGLRNIILNFLCVNKKKKKNLTIFYISYKSSIKTFLTWSTKKWSKDTP